MSLRNRLLKNRRRIIKNCIFLSIMLIAALAGYLMAMNTDPATPKQEEEEPLAAAANEQRTAEGCVITWEFVYETCGHTIKAESKIAQEMAGLTLKEFESKFSDIRVLDFSPKAVTLQKKIHQYCPNHYILKVNGSVLGIFRNELGTDKMALYMPLEISYSQAPEELRTALFYGEVFNSVEEAESFVSKKIQNDN